MVNETVNEILAAGIASPFLSPPSSHSNLDSSLNVPVLSLGLDPVKSIYHLNFVERTGGGFDVTQLPVEIICEILEKFVEDDLPHPVRDDTPLPLVSHTCRSDPTKLGQICSRWRAVAVNLPNLWSNILIYNPKFSQVYLTDVWLERSGNNPLDLEINFDHTESNYDLRSATRILQSFIAHLGRWKNFHLDMSIELLGPLYTIVHSPRRPHILESVSFEFYNAFRDQHAEVHIDEIWKYFHGCPTLRLVVWSGAGVYSFPTHAPFQLTHVQVGFFVSIDDILPFLPQIPLIQELQIDDLSKDSSVTISGQQVLLQHLRILTICSHEVPASSFIARLTCPSLETLTINHSNYLDESNQDLQEIPRLLRRSGCYLQQLDLCDSGINIADYDLERCLSESPLRSLTYLPLWMGGISDQMVGLLSRKSTDGSHEFAPFLEALDFPSWNTGTTDGLLASVISSRWYQALDHNHSTPLGHLRNAVITPTQNFKFGPIDEAFLRENGLY
ncbi:hypothetical protein M413DRAFT_31912 [Hebeloma cylindrosporum]|uniref:Uncharacterized protein n=1 Tax=Hebeloma cylindrosporum TaxID=76867 RepID=A0A0C2XE37_HEBCY|nr:hypothetical protein M413DRAFT_31912 [Hebeloma cylindrosporum h7]